MPRPPRLLIAVAAVAVLGVAAVLARPGTAVEEDAVSAARASLAPPVPSAVPEAPARPGADLVVRADGVDGLRLGMGVEEVVAGGFSLQQRAYDGCRRILPGLADVGPGEGVAGWLVDDEVAVVTVDARAGSGPSFLGAGPGDALDDLPGGVGVDRFRTAHPVPWQEAPVEVDVVAVEPSSGRRAAFADLSGDGLIDHVQLRADAGSRCGTAWAAGLRSTQAGVPPLRPDGWGEVSVGMPLARAATLLDLQPGAVPGPGSAGTSQRVGRCRLVLGDDEPGLVYLVVGRDAATGTEVVRAVAVDAGRTASGLRVGDPAERVQDAYPGITEAYLDDRWDQGLIADWQLPDGELRLAPGREQVVLAEVDAVLTGPRNVVGIIQLGPGC